MKKLLMVFMTVALLACNNDVLDSLQTQIDDLGAEVGQLKADQAAALEAAIAAVITDISALEAGNADQAAELAALLANLEQLQADLADAQSDIDNVGSDVADQASMVYWGNLASDDDFAAFATAGNSVVSGYVVVSNQGQADNLTAVEVIGGDLLVSGATTLDISGLTIVGGELVVEGSDLTDLSAASLMSIGDDFAIEDNPSLATVSMPALALVAGEFYINNKYYDDVNYVDVATITTIDFSTLVQVGNDFTLQNLAVADVNFPELTAVNGSFDLSNDVELSTMNFAKLGAVDGNFYFTNNTPAAAGCWICKAAAITVMNNFNALTEINGSVDISSNAEISEIIGFDALTAFDGQISITSNAGLTLFDAFNAVTESGKIKFEGNGASDNTGSMIFDGFASLTTTGYNGVDINYNYQVNSISGFDALTGINGTLNINGNTGDLAIPGFAVLASVQGIKLNYNGQQIWGDNGVETFGFPTLTGFAALTSVSYYGIEVSGNANLQTIDAFNGVLGYSQMEISITWNEKLETINAFDVMDQAKSLSISGNPLTAITGFSALTSVYKWGNGATIEAGGADLCAFNGFVTARFADYNNGLTGSTAVSMTDKNGVTFTDADLDQAVVGCP